MGDWRAAAGDDGHHVYAMAFLQGRLRNILRRRILSLGSYVYDRTKDQAKHGVFLALTEVRFAGPHVVTTDDRFECGEVAFGLIDDRLFVCVYTDRRAERRVISLRKANKREVKRYGEGLEQSGARCVGRDGLEQDRCDDG